MLLGILILPWSFPQETRNGNLQISWIFTWTVCVAVCVDFFYVQIKKFYCCMLVSGLKNCNCLFEMLDRFFGNLCIFAIDHEDWTENRKFHQTSSILVLIMNKFREKLIKTQKQKINFFVRTFDHVKNLIS